MSLFELHALPAGTVELHDARRKRRWSVALEAFEIAAVPVTAAQYSSVMGPEVRETQVPMTDISWMAAVTFCNVASQREGLDLAYSINEDAVTWRTDSSGYRLPTEAEWEYACRALTTGPHYSPLDEIAWTTNDRQELPQIVGLKQANEFGLYDTLGNVWEWCWDFLDPARYGDYRVFRGGGFADESWSVRASTRRGGAPGMSHADVGLRLARGALPATLSGTQTVQGWSAEADSVRGRISGALPSGWTPRKF